MTPHPPDSIRLNLLDPMVREAILTWWAAAAARNEPIKRDEFIQALGDNLLSRGIPTTSIDTSAVWSFIYPDFGTTIIRSEA